MPKNIKKYIDNHIQQDITINGKPVRTGRRVDNKWEYYVKFTINSLPNNALKDYDVNLPSDIKITKIENTIYFPNGDTSTMPYSYKDYTDIQTPAYRKEENLLRIVTASDRSSVSAEIYFYFTYNN